MKHRVKTIEGLAKILGKKRFLELAGYFTCHVKETVSDTIYEMSQRWYSRWGDVLESEKFIEEYNLGYFD